MAGLYLSAEMTGALINCRRMSHVIEKVMLQLRKTRNTRIQKDPFLQSNFQCDMRLLKMFSVLERYYLVRPFVHSSRP